MLQNSVFLKLNYISLYSIRYTSPLSIRGLWVVSFILHVEVQTSLPVPFSIWTYLGGDWEYKAMESVDYMVDLLIAWKTVSLLIELILSPANNVQVFQILHVLSKTTPR